MKKIVKAMAVVMALALSVMVFAACGSSGQPKEVAVKGDSSAAVDPAATEAVSSNDGVDYSKVDITINDGDFAAMKELATAMQSGGNQGKVVKVTGINSRSQFGAKASVMESDGGSSKIGTTYKIVGVDSIDQYPEDDAKIELTGVVKLDDNGISCYIEVTQEHLITK